MRQLVTASAAVLCVMLGQARADAPELEALELVRAPDGTPRLEATLLGQPANLSLRDASAGESAPAITVRDYAQGTEPIAIAVVYNGQEIWLGNETFEGEDSPARYLGALAGIARSVDIIHGTALPAGSRGVLVSYADGAQLRVPMGPIDRMTGATLGSQRDYRNKIGAELVSGIQLAVAQLERTQMPLKALIVLGDGNDTNNEAARLQLADLKKRCARDGIRTYGVIYKGQLSEPGQVITRLVPHAVTVASFDGMAESMQTIMHALTDRTYATFPIPEDAFDGKVHAYVVRADRQDLDPVSVMMPKAPSRAWLAWLPHLGAWWQQLFAGFGLVALLALGLRLRHGMTRAS